MPSDISPKIISENLMASSKLFGPNELAYLALTSKIEIPIRDRLAFHMHKNFSERGYLVSREWKRCDLAIIRNEKAVALLELKAMYTFDAIGKHKYLDSVKNMIDSDFIKAHKYAENTTSVFALLLATHLHEKVENGLKNIVKYESQINKSLSNNTEKEIYDTCCENVKRIFDNYSAVSGCIKTSKCFGTEVSILFWVLYSDKGRK